LETSNSGLHLFDEPDVLLVGAQDVLERVRLTRLGIDDCVDGASRTFSQSLQYLIVEEFLGHEDIAHLDSVSPVPLQVVFGGGAGRLTADDDYDDRQPWAIGPIRLCPS
jgi:hypothetical protein